MKPLTWTIPILCIAVLSCAPVVPSTEQNNQTMKLEERVRALEQKVKMLETRLLSMRGGKTMEALRVKGIMTSEINNISNQALQYFRRPGSLNGGGGSFAGFSLSPKLAQTDVATYTVVPGDTDLVIEGQAIILNGKIRTRVSSKGEPTELIYTGDLLEARSPVGMNRPSPDMNWEILRQEATRIVDNASEYRNRPVNLGGGGGSYSNYAIPQAIASSNLGMYAVVRADTSIVLEVRPKTSNTVGIATGDSAGKVRNWSTVFTLADPKRAPSATKSTADSVREVITGDFIAIAARAYQYKIRPNNAGGGGGKYTGYLSAQTSSFDGTVKYELQVDPEVIILRANSTRGFGSVSARLDASGKLTGWYYTGRLAE